jgi:hypothetical protein
VSDCSRGCTAPRRHVFVEGQGRACGDDCTGCLPRQAEYGHLCFDCHKRLKRMFTEAPGQHAVLEADVAPSFAQHLHAETQAKITTMWRTSTMQDDASGLYAHPQGASGQESEPIRLACLDVAQELSDWLSQLVERLCDDYAMTGPPRSLNGPESDPQRCGHPPFRFEVVTASEWLVEQIGRVEYYPGIADDFEDLRMLMAQAHALRPWREQVARIPGVPCPNCHRTTLVRYGGEVDVECQTKWCGSVFEPERYGVWVRMLHEEHRQAMGQ